MTLNLNHVGFSFSKSKLQLVEVVKESTKYYLENVDEHIFDSEIDFRVDENQIINILQVAFHSILERVPIKSKSISFSLPIKLFSIFTIPYDSSLTEEELKEHIFWEASILLPHKDMSKEIIKTIKLKSFDNSNRLLIVAVPRDLIKSLFNFAKQNNMSLKFADIASFASDSLVKNSTGNILSIYFDDSRLVLTTYFNGNISDCSVFEYEMTNSIIDLVEKYIEDKNIAFDNFYIASNYDFEELKIELENKLDVTLQVFNPFEKIETSDSFIQNAYFLNRPNSFSAAAGISFRKF